MSVITAPFSTSKVTATKLFGIPKLIVSPNIIWFLTGGFCPVQSGISCWVVKKLVPKAYHSFWYLFVLSMTVINLFFLCLSFPPIPINLSLNLPDFSLPCFFPSLPLPNWHYRQIIIVVVISSTLLPSPPFPGRHRNLFCLFLLSSSSSSPLVKPISVGTRAYIVFVCQPLVPFWSSQGLVWISYQNFKPRAHVSGAGMEPNLMGSCILPFVVSCQLHDSVCYDGLTLYLISKNAEKMPCTKFDYCVKLTSLSLCY